MRNFKDPQNIVWDNAGLETWGARCKMLWRLWHKQKTKHEI